MKIIIKKEWLWLFIIVILTFVAYLKVIFFDFLYWDDDKQIFNNIYVSHLTWKHLLHNFMYERFTFIPLTLYSILYNIVGKNPFYFHLASIIFHSLNVILFFIIIKKFRFSLFVLIFSTIIFALHPLRIESVAWISEWKDLLFTLFSLAGIWFYIKWTEQNKFVYVFLYSVMFVLSSFSKIQGLILPFSTLLLDVFLYKQLRLKFVLINAALLAFVLLIYIFEVRILALLFLLLYFIHRKYRILQFVNNIKIKPVHYFVLSFFLIVIISWYFITKQLWFWENISNFLFSDRLVFSGFALTFYLQHFFLPIQQIAVFSYPSISGIDLWTTWWFYLLIWPVTITLALWLYRKKYFVELFGFLFFLINISIVLHLIPIEGRLLVADRYTYLAYAGLILSASQFINRFLKEKTLWQLFVKISIITIFFVLTFIRLDIWKNTENLFFDVLKKRPKTFFAWQNLGSYYLEKKDYYRAEKCYTVALKLEPTNSQLLLNKALVLVALNKTIEATNNLKEAMKYSNSDEEKSFILLTIGQIEAEQGQIHKAMNYYKQAINYYPKNYKAYLQKALIFANTKQIINVDSAIYYAKKSIETNSYYSDAYNTLSWLYLIKQDLSKAEKYAYSSIKSNPYYPLAYNTLGYIKQIEGKYDTALMYYEQALKLDSTQIEIRKNRAWMYYQFNKYQASVEDYNYVLSKQPTDLVALTNRAFCFVRLNRHHQAIIDFKKILLLQPDSADSYYNIGWAFIQANQLDSALNYINKTLNLNNKHVKALFDRAMIFYNKKMYEQALENFSKIQQLYPENAEIYYWIGIVYDAKLEKNKACEYYNISYSKGFQGVKTLLQKCNK